MWEDIEDGTTVSAFQTLRSLPFSFLSFMFFLFRPSLEILLKLPNLKERSER